jgi:hypothetical protein
VAVSTIYNTPLLAQTGSFAPVVMATLGADGNYRVGLYMWAPAFGTNNKDIIVMVTWVDPSGVTQSFSVGLFTSNAGVNSVRGDVTFRAIAGSNITLQPGANQNDGTDSYDLYPNVEQL